jgi:CHASE3 domain sensor protein
MVSFRRKEALTVMSNLGTTVARTLAVPVLMLVALAIALSAWIAHMKQAEGWVQHTYEVMGLINRCERLLIDQETGLRGYLLSGDPRFLKPYDSGRAEFGENLDQLAHATADNPSQVQRIAAIRGMDRRWLVNAEAERIAPPADRGAVFVARMAARKQEMDNLRRTFDDLSGEEQHLLSERTANAKRADRALLYAGLVLIILGSIVVVLFLRGQLRDIDAIYMAKVEESDRERHAAEAMASEIREQAGGMEAALLAARRERDEAVRRLSGKSSS